MGLLSSPPLALLRVSLLFPPRIAEPPPPSPPSSIAESEPSEMLSRRLDNINNHFTYALYCNVCRSLFEKDKLLFAFLLATRVLKFHGNLPPAEYDFLLTNGIGIKVSDMEV